MNQNGKTTKKKSKGCLIALIIMIIAFIGAIFFFIIMPIFFIKKSTDAYLNNTEQKIEQSKNLVYKDVLVFKGNGKKKSESFHLSGNGAKIIYKYSSGANNMGIFNVYVVKEGNDIMVQGGIPEIFITSDKEESETTIRKRAGDYYLDVDGYGNWEIIVQDKQ